ncbi:restriction endonuclease subunit S [Halosquirtibacter xylanolyticus]|uniref:restriction endonuclease subunit S n=1 Tax=Halosquirtibacter xylanolyticus TaxID=3374599 RepID=UPI00374A0A4A|nr:restriction endonuclease subunit S [Prolixibacteraceae bacterium]
MKHLLQHFKNISTSPQNIDKIKDLILTLAIQGKLTQNWRTQNPNTQSAETLFQEIQEEKLRLINEKKIKKEKKFPEITKEEIPFAIPNSWKWTRLGEISNYGTTIKVESKDVDKDTWILELEDIEKKTSRLIQKVKVHTRHFKSTKNRFTKNDIIYGKLRPYLDKVIVANEDGVCSTELIPIKTYGNINPFYCRLFLKSSFFIQYANSSTHGMRMPRLGTSKAKEAICPLPPLEEQKQIVSTVEKLFNKLDQLQEKTVQRIKLKEDFVTSALNELNSSKTVEVWKMLTPHFKTFFSESKNVKELRDTILQLAIQGKLTQNWRAQNPNTQSAETLFQEIQEEKLRLIKEKKIKKEKKFPEITKEEIPFAIPNSWKWTRLGEISKIYGGGTPKSTELDYYSVNSKKGIPWITPADLGRIKTKYISRGKKDISELGLAKSSAQLMPKGAVLFSSRAPIGHTAIAQNPVSTNQGFKSSVPYILEMNQYIYYYLNSIVKDVNEKATGTTFKEVSGAIVSCFICPLPPLEEQKQIVSTVEKLLTLCDQLEENIAKSKTLHHQWSKSISKHITI